MRSLHADLTAAQKTPSAVPYIVVRAENMVESARRLDFTTLNTVANTTTKHDMCVASTTPSIQRFRTTGGSQYHNKVTDPTAAANFDSWTLLGAGNGNQIACSATGSNVAYVFVNAAGTGIYFRESTDEGASFGGATLIATAGVAVQDLACAYKTGGDIVVAWVTATQLFLIRRTAGAWGAVQTNPNTFAALNGVAMVKGFDWEMVVTGQEVTTTKPTIYTVLWGDGASVAVNTWGGLYRLLQGESGLTTFQSPFVDYADTWRVTYVEVPAYTGGTTRAYRTYLNPARSWIDGHYVWRTPTPVNDVNATGIALAADLAAGWQYESSANKVKRASWAAATLDLSASVLALDLLEDQWDGHGWLDIQNNDAAYAEQTTPGLLALGNLVSFQFGYFTASGNRASQVQDFFISAIEWRRRGGVSVVRLHLESFWRIMRRSYQQMQVVHTADTLRTIITNAMARAGLLVLHNNASARSNTISPKFTIPATTSGYAAVRQACALLPDRFILKAGAAAWFTETLTSETTDYTLGTDHAIYELQYRSEPVPVSEAQAVSVSGTAQLAGIATEYADAEQGRGARASIRDLTSVAAGTIQATATAHLRQRKLDARYGRVIVPPICGLELMDMVDFADGYVNIATQLRRVMSIRWQFDRGENRYQQELALGPA